MSQRARYVIPTKIGEQYTEERVYSTKRREYIKARLFNKHRTSDNYEDSIIFDMRLFNQVIFEIKNEHSSNALKYKILACIEPDSWHEIKPETTLNANSKTYETLSEPWAYAKIQVKSATSGNSAICTVYVAGKAV